jgi:hypothetical protein
MTVLGRTWLATTLFVLTAMAVWWKLIDLEAAWRHLLPTLLLTPLIWWVVVGRQPKTRLWHGIIGGALTGFVTQSAQNVPDFLRLFVHRGTGDGEDQAIAIASVTVYLLIGLGATILGALVGLVAVVAERRVEGTTP